MGAGLLIMTDMTKPYGKTPKKKTARSPRKKKTDSNTLKVKLRGKDGAPLAMNEFQQGLYDLALKVKPYGNYRVKYATLYMTVVDENGDEVIIEQSGEWVLYPYDSAADEHGV